jgi:D-glycero-D-manno-heptose 1,7-bisphosphate phosphatase
MLFRAAEDFNIELNRSIFVGDSETDLQAGLAAGCRPLLFGPGLFGSPGAPDWIAKIPRAPSSKELFDVAARCLRSIPPSDMDGAR